MAETQTPGAQGRTSQINTYITATVAAIYRVLIVRSLDIRPSQKSAHVSRPTLPPDSQDTNA